MRFEGLYGQVVEEQVAHVARLLVVVEHVIDVDRALGAGREQIGEAFAAKFWVDV